MGDAHGIVMYNLGNKRHFPFKICFMTNSTAGRSKRMRLTKEILNLREYRDLQAEKIKKNVTRIHAQELQIRKLQKLRQAVARDVYKKIKNDIKAIVDLSENLIN